MSTLLFLSTLVAVTTVISARLQGASGWDNSPDAQYHIQTDEGPERYFRYQTTSGQYRKEKRLEDGSVVGTYGWIDPNGFLRLRDYVADNTGYRVVRTKMLFVGKDDPIADAVAKSKKVPSQGGTGVQTNALTPTTAAPPASTTQTPTPTPISSYPYPQPEVSSNALPYTPSYLDPNVAPFYFNQPYVGAASNRRDYQVPYQGYPVYQQQVQQQPQQQQQPAPYDGISTTANGFRYYLPRHYHEEETAGDTRAGSFGYIDPFGIRRVVYYNSAPDTGFVHKKNNRYVGFNATPYDPRF